MLAGTLLTVAGLRYGNRFIVALTVFVAILPVFALLIGLVGRPRVDYTRTITPPQVTRDGTVTCRIRIERPKQWSTTLWRFSDVIPDSFGFPPHLRAKGSLTAWRGELVYTLQCLDRGVFQIGPLKLEQVDPFGLTRRLTSHGATTQLLVGPIVYPLSRVAVSRGIGHPGETSPQSIGFHGLDDVLIREHQQSDGTRRIHWRSSARQGQLMVRREEQSLDSAVAILIDNRAVAWQSQDDFEWAVSAAASIAYEMLKRGQRVRLVDAAGIRLAPEHRSLAANQAEVTVSLAAITLIDTPTLDAAVRALHTGGGQELTQAILGSVGAGEVGLMGTLHGVSQALFAAEIDPSVHRALTASGWSCLESASRIPMADAWRKLELLR